MKLKLIFNITVLFLMSIGLQAQIKGTTPVANQEINSTGVTRAVIIGISNYQNPKITDLEFADRDAREFSKYLTSKAGGSVDTSNIMLLTNEKATAGQFVSALYWLMEESKKDDQAIIYFSGHGDVENNTMNQPGFLLCWDAPSKVYMGGGTFGLIYLQEIISTLSTQTQAKVLVITDACRAGKLAGSSINGTQATASNLAKQYASEVKIMSCQANEFSLEGKNWGNGRGVFSYYFLAGLQGLADRNQDGFVNLQEIERYLDDKVPDAVAPHSQIPMTVGNKTIVISKVDPDVLKSLKDPDLERQMSVTGNKGLESSILGLSDSIIFRKYQLFNKALSENHLLYPEEGAAYTLYNQLKDVADLKKFEGLMRRNLAAALQDEAQQAINDYLRADPAEMKKRWSFDSRYAKFPEYLEKAAVLMGEKHFFYGELKAREHYFKGVNLRLKAEQTNNDSVLLKSALAEQNICVQLQPKAAYAFNEIGWCYYGLEKYNESLNYYKKAVQLCPQWALPWSNLCASYRQLNDFQQSEFCGKKALEIDSLFALAMLSLADSYRDFKNLPSAKKYYQLAIQTDPELDFSYMNYGLILFEEGQYEEANELFKQFNKLKPNQIDGLINLGQVNLRMNREKEALEYFQKVTSLAPESDDAFQCMIEFYFHFKYWEKATTMLEIYLKKVPNDSFAYYLLAAVSVHQNQTEKCLIYLESAFYTGFKDIDLITNDHAFKSVIGQPEFQTLMSKYFKSDRK